MRFSSSSRHLAESPPTDEHSNFVYVPSSVFLTLSTFYSSQFHCGFISPHYRVQDSPFKGFPYSLDDTPHQRVHPLLSLARFTYNK